MCLCGGSGHLFRCPSGRQVTPTFTQHALLCIMYICTLYISLKHDVHPSHLLSLFCACLCLVGMCVKLWFAFLCHIERIHTILYSHNPFVFPLLFIHHSLYFSFHSSLLFLLISFMFTSLFLPRNVPADIPNLFFFLHPFISLPSNTLVLLFCLHLKLPLSLFLSFSLLSWCQ